VDLAIVDVTRRFYKQEARIGNEWFRANKNKKINNNYHESIWLSKQEHELVLNGSERIKRSIITIMKAFGYPDTNIMNEKDC